MLSAYALYLVLELNVLLWSPAGQAGVVVVVCGRQEEKKNDFSTPEGVRIEG